MIYLSAPNSDGFAVDLLDSEYGFSDYHPMRVDNLLSSNPQATVDLRLKSTVTVGQDNIPPGDYPLDFQGYVNLLGIPGVRSASNSLLFSPLWESGQRDEKLAFKERAGTPAVYFRVFRDTGSQNLFPIAIQYWFFYFYNDWFLNHPGDWESVTVFLDADTNPREIVFSAYNEANRYTWTNELFEETRSADHFSVFVSNGGHGSYAYAGETNYSGVKDLHWGDGGTLDYLNGDYVLIDLGALEQDPYSWIWFEGRWGNDGVDIPEDEDPAPNGPRFRTDAASGGDWFRSMNRPYDPFNECKRRDYGAVIYDPWYWASGYGLNVPWESPDDCQDASFNIMPPDGIQRAVSGNQLYIGWNSVSNASGYRVLLGVSPGVYTSEFDSAGSTTFSTYLENDTYYLALVAFNQFSQSEISQEIAVTVGPNSSPLSAPVDANVLVEDEKVTISWGTVFGASGYIARYGLESGQYTGSLDLGNITSIETELPPGSYFLKIAGYGGIDKTPGLYTDEIEVFVSDPLDTPVVVGPGSSVPPIPVIANLTTALKWDAVEGADYYKLSLRDFTLNKSVFNIEVEGTTSFVATGLLLGHSYWWTVSACNSSTCSDSSSRHYFQVN
ncbi:MAG: hypothetical protein R3F41_07865 [Gammaproteobacteria bacterium]|nr:hypothetical protein [Pseudomonadales bacterium]MCP5349275.1 hypothetical protein [Pseudomonadales bacterium]